jgi:hypothetical protein
MSDYLQIQFWKFAKWLIIRGYGPGCETSDLCDFKDMYKTPQDVFAKGRCASCRAKEIVDWIDNHIELLRT